ncbi:MAG TPA: hypothetical protein VMV69_14440 [Pirellulales bacterium]|nr:hypothetical protein [Pirellulales bacterium]
MEPNTNWRQCFQKWPKDVPPRGVLVTNYDEQIPFEGFMAGDTMLLVERKTPDTAGARKVLLPYDHVLAVKLVDVVRGKSFEELGFVGKLKD